MKNASKALCMAGLIALAPQLGAQCEDQKIVASDGAALDGFGGAVAIANTLAVVGAPAADGQGAAYVIQSTLGGWVERAKLVASDAAPGDLFGFTVAIDFHTVVVGAIFNDDAGDETGAAYVFEPQGTGWVETAKLVGSDAQAGDLFSIGLTVDDDRIVVGACQFFGFMATGFGKGKAYVFEHAGAVWNEVDILTASDGADGDRFAVSASIEAERLLLGAEDDDLAAGSAYVFELDTGTWVERDKLVAGDRADGDQFGVAVSLSGDRALIGAQNDDDDGMDSGAAYMFELTGPDWLEVDKLTASDAAAEHHLGRSVTLEGDLAVVGARQENLSGAGAAYLFEPAGPSWTETRRLAADDGELGDQFGFAVYLDRDTLFVGANADDPGSLYEFEFHDSPPAPAIVTYGCGANPAGSLTVLGGLPALGSTVDLGVDNPLGTQNPGASTFLFVSLSPDPQFPCGTLLANFGMNGPGELLVNLLPGELVATETGPAWAGQGNPALFSVDIPNKCELLGLSAYLQGLIFDPTPGNRFGFTEAVEFQGGMNP